MLTRPGTTSFDSGRVCLGVQVGPHPLFRIGTCVDRTQVSLRDTSCGEMEDGLGIRPGG